MTRILPMVCVSLIVNNKMIKLSKLLKEFGLSQPPNRTVTFRPRSTGVAGTVSNAEGFACCCRAANDEDGYRVGPGQEFELTAVGVAILVGALPGDNLL